MRYWRVGQRRRSGKRASDGPRPGPEAAQEGVEVLGGANEQEGAVVKEMKEYWKKYWVFTLVAIASFVLVRSCLRGEFGW